MKRLTDEELEELVIADLKDVIDALPLLIEELRDFREREAQRERVNECSKCGYMDGNGGYYINPNCKECRGGKL